MALQGSRQCNETASLEACRYTTCVDSKYISGFMLCAMGLSIVCTRTLLLKGSGGRHDA